MFAVADLLGSRHRMLGSRHRINLHQVRGIQGRLSMNTTIVSPRHCHCYCTTRRRPVFVQCHVESKALAARPTPTTFETKRSTCAKSRNTGSASVVPRVRRPPISPTWPPRNSRSRRDCGRTSSSSVPRPRPGRWRYSGNALLPHQRRRPTRCLRVAGERWMVRRQRRPERRNAR